jgi:hypothetical protein
MDTRNIQGFMEGVVAPDKLEEYIKYVSPVLIFKINFRMRMPILQAMNRFIRKYKEQEIRVIDTAALICTALWADGKQISISKRLEILAEKMDIENEQIHEHRERILSEWTNNLTATYGPDKAGIKMARMLCLLVDLNVSRSFSVILG